MAKQTKTLADVQTVTTVNDDQLIPITDASGNVVKVSMSNLRAALIGNMQVSSINVVDGSESVTVDDSAGNGNYYKALNIGDVKEGEYYAISIKNIENLAGNPNKWTAQIYESGESSQLSNILTFTSANNVTGIFKINKSSINGKASILLYAGYLGQTAGNIVKYNNVMLVRGNMPCPSWFPSYNDIKALVAAGSTTTQS